MNNSRMVASTLLDVRRATVITVAGLFVLAACAPPQSGVPPTASVVAAIAELPKAVDQTAPTELAAVSQQDRRSTSDALAPSPTPSPSSDASTAISKRGRIALGYYVPYDVSSWWSLQAHASELNYVALQWVSIDPCGNLGSQDDRTLVALARANGIAVLPSLMTSNPTLNHRLLTDAQASARAVGQIVDYVVEEGYDGIDLDMEDVLPSDRLSFTAFIAKVSQALHEKHKLLSVALPAKRYDTNTGRSAAYDYAALAPNVDYALIMAYAYSWATSAPGSTAPFEWVDEVMGYVTGQFPSEKVLLGLAFYGYDWNTSSGDRARALRYDQALSVARQYGAVIATDPATRSATFSYTARTGAPLPDAAPLPAVKHDIVTRKPAACARPLPTPISTPPLPPTTPRPSPTAPVLQNHVVWLEDAASVAARLGLADKYNLAGVGAWRLGQEDPAVWRVLDQWQQTVR